MNVRFRIAVLLITASWLGVCCADEPAEMVSKTEHFDRDPGWEAYKNRIVPERSIGCRIIPIPGTKATRPAAATVYCSHPWPESAPLIKFWTNFVEIPRLTPPIARTRLDLESREKSRHEIGTGAFLRPLKQAPNFLRPLGPQPKQSLDPGPP